MKSLFAWSYSFLPVFIAVFVIVLLSVLCSGCYTMKQGMTMIGYLGRAVPLEELAGKEGAGGENLLFVRRAEDIRRFAMEELGLEKSKNYTRYVELDRDYLAAVVSASAKDSFNRHEWWFPVVGSVPYKGFFNVEDARKERAKLEKKDLDVWVRGVDAFSTLGWFRDPLYSYMKRYSERDLAELIIHELLHATVFLKNHVQFNEELAEFVGAEGARLYMEKIRGSAALPGGADGTGGAGADGTGGVGTGGAGGGFAADGESEEAAAEADSAAYLAFIRGLIAELDAVYTSGVSREEKLRRKEEIIGAAKISFDENYDANFKTDNYRFFGELPVNNAYLELFRLYHEEEHYFNSLYGRSGRNLPAFIAAAKSLAAKKTENPREELEQALNLK